MSCKQHSWNFKKSYLKKILSLSSKWKFLLFTLEAITYTWVNLILLLFQRLVFFFESQPNLTY